MTSSDRQPLLPSAAARKDSVHSHSASKLSAPRISFPSLAGGEGGGGDGDLEAGRFSTGTRGAGSGIGTGVGVVNRREGIPKLTWEYLWS
jgi:hypothetical protein